VRRVLSNKWLANLKKNYLTSGFFGTPFLCHQRNGVKEKKCQEKEKSVQSKTYKTITKTNICFFKIKWCKKLPPTAIECSDISHKPNKKEP